MHDLARLRLTALALLLCAGGCTREPDPATAARVAAPGAGSVCDRHLLAPADAQAVLRDRVVGTRNLPGDGESCYFVSAGADRGGSQLLVTLRPSGGMAALAAFRSGHMDAYATSRALAGVGDEAVWLPDLLEVDARRGDTLCVVQPNGLSELVRAAGDDGRRRAIGALCKRIFAALHARG